MENAILIIIGLTTAFAALAFIRFADTTVRIPIVYGCLSEKRKRNNRHIIKFINEKMNEALQLGYTLMMAGDNSLRRYGIYSRDVLGVRLFYPHEKFTVRHHPSIIFLDDTNSQQFAKFVGYVDDVRDWHKVFEKYAPKVSLQENTFVEQMISSYSYLKESGAIVNDNIDTLALVESFDDYNNPTYSLICPENILGQANLILNHHITANSDSFDE